MELKSLNIKNDLYWVGSLDPNLRVFDIIMYTPYGTTYNSYVLKANDKTVLFETVKAKHFNNYLERLKDLNIDLNKIDYVVVSHTEPDHAGSVEKILELSPNVKIVATQNAINYLKEIVNGNFEYIIVKDNDTLKIENKTLRFVEAPLLHWPDTMYTYIEEDEVLVTCDSFGSHYSCEGIVNSKIENKEHYMDALRYYYDCIMGPFKQYVVNAVDKIKDLKIDVICPGHGPVLVENPMEIVDIYYNWSKNEIIVPKKDVTICYVSAYGYTETIANNIKAGIEANSDYNVIMYDVINHNMDEILGSIANSQAVLFGTPTINGDALKPIWDVLVSLNPIVHGTKVASAFGSYGWSGEGVPNTMQRLEQLRMKLVDPMIINFKPSQDDINNAVEFGRKFIEKTIDNYSFKNSTKKWKCVICSEIFDGNQAPDVCPVCGAKHDQFIEIVVENITFKKDTNESFVVVGNGAAGFYAVDAIRKRNKTCNITMISNEKELSYFRPALSDFINKDINKEEFYIVDKTWYEDNNINLLLGYNVESINEENNTIILDNNEELKYSKLILANGSSNFIPPIKGKELNGVYTLRNKQDLDNIKEALDRSKKVVVIGGGLLGLEAAYEIVLKGIDTTVVEAMPNLLSRQLDSEGSEILQSSIKKSNIKLILDKCVDRLEGNDNISKVVFKDGSSIDADMVIFSIGVRPNTNITKNTTININRGIIVDKKMKTSSPNIYACGDVAEIDNIVWAIWPAAIDMGKVAGANAVGDEIEFKVEKYPVGLEAFDNKVFSVGNINDYDGCLTLKDNKNYKYKKLFFKEDILVGAIYINNLDTNVVAMAMIEDKANMSKVLKNNIL